MTGIAPADISVLIAMITGEASLTAKGLSRKVRAAAVFPPKNAVSLSRMSA